MQGEINRPLSVWVTQALLFFGCLQLFVVIIVGLFFCVSKNEVQQCLSSPRVSFLAISFCILLFELITFWGLQKRRLYGKWLGAIFLLTAMIGSIIESHYFQLVYSSIAQGKPLPTPPYDCWQGSLASVDQSYCGYSSYLDLALRGTLDALFPQVLLALVAVRLISSRASKRFFGRVKMQSK